MRLFQRFAGRQNGKRAALAGFLDPLRAMFGDPDGRKARTAGDRARVTAPMDPDRRIDAYRRQGGRRPKNYPLAITPTQRRRLVKKLRRHGAADEARHFVYGKAA